MLALRPPVAVLASTRVEAVGDALLVIAATRSPSPRPTSTPLPDGNGYQIVRGRDLR